MSLRLQGASLPQRNQLKLDTAPDILVLATVRGVL